MKMLKYVFLFALLTSLAACATDSADEFSPAPAPSAAPASNRAASPERAPAPRLAEVPAGTNFDVVLIDAISTGKNKAGDRFMASLAEPIVVNGNTVVGKGTKVQGRIVDAEGSGRVKGRANIRMVLTSIIDGEKSFPIVTKPLVAEAEGSKGRDAALIGGAVGLGAAIGAIAGGGDGAAKGALIGGGAGAGTVLATKGKEVEFDPESKLRFTLGEAAELPRIAGKIS
jgi:hypothetical protein